MNSRLLVQDLSDTKLSEYAAERLPISKPLHSGERVRLSVEAPRSGFLYVIDRERSADGSLGDPYLIFPTLSIRDGENGAAPGHVIDIPPTDGVVRALREERHGATHVGEMLLFFVSEQPLLGMPIGLRETKIPTFILDELQLASTAANLRLDLAGTPQSLTAPERNVAMSSNCLLTQDDPMPQSIFAVPRRSSEPLLVSVPLEIR